MCVFSMKTQTLLLIYSDKICQKGLTLIRVIKAKETMMEGSRKDEETSHALKSCDIFCE